MIFTDGNGLLHQLGYLLDFLGHSFYRFDLCATVRTVFQLKLFHLVWLAKSIAGRGIAVRGRGQALFDLFVGAYCYPVVWSLPSSPRLDFEAWVVILGSPLFPFLALAFIALAF